MTKVEEIKQAIEALPEKDFIRLREWFSEKDWDKWDKELEADANSGKLDFIVKEANDAKYNGELKDL